MSVNNIISRDCLSDEVLSCRVKGLLSIEQGKLVQAHLDSCERCMELVQALEAVSAAGEELQYAVVPSDVMQTACNLVSLNNRGCLLKAVFTVIKDVYTAVQTEAHIVLAPWLSSDVAFRGQDENVKGLIVLESHSTWGQCRFELSHMSAGRHKVAVRFESTEVSSAGTIGNAVLFCEGVEMESQPVHGGVMIFEDLLSGHYHVELTSSSGLAGQLVFSLVTS